MAKAIGVPDEYIPTVSFSFPKDSKKAVPAPDNFDSLKVDSKVKVVIVGEVESVSHDSYGKSFSVRLKKITLSGLEKPMGVAEGMAKIKEKRTT
jgi:hypothetical protein